MDVTALAVVLREPGALDVEALTLREPEPDELRVAVDFTGISTGTERLLYQGDMPPFPGLAYPLVPGYESVGRVVQRGRNCTTELGQTVFVSGADCFKEARGLFGGAASSLIVAETRARPIPSTRAEDATLLALAATAWHALHLEAEPFLPDLIVGHGTLGRVLARLTQRLGAEPVVWERDPARRDAKNYRVIDPAADTKTDYRRVIDVSGNSSIINAIAPHIARRAEVVLAGFYKTPVAFDFPPVFMKETRFSVAAEWQPSDMDAVVRMASVDPQLLADLITHRQHAAQAKDAYVTAFNDPHCLKMVLDWRDLA